MSWLIFIPLCVLEIYLIVGLIIRWCRDDAERQRLRVGRGY